MEGWMHLYFAGIRVQKKLARPLRGQDTQRVAKMSHEQISLTFHGCFCFFHEPHITWICFKCSAKSEPKIFSPNGGAEKNGDESPGTKWITLNSSKEIGTSTARIWYIHQGLGINWIHLLSSWIQNTLWNEKVEKLKEEAEKSKAHCEIQRKTLRN